MQTRKGYYTKTATGYRCIVCGKEFNGSSARHSAKRCCGDKKPLSLIALRAAEDILSNSYHVPTPRTKQPGDGELHKDKWGHWRRGKKKHDKAQLRADYNKTFQKIAEQLDKEQQAFLDELFYSLDDTITDWLNKYHSERSIDQKIAYAFNTGNYALLKSYIQQAISDAVTARDLYLRNNPGELTPEPPPTSTMDLRLDIDVLNDLKNVDLHKDF